MRHRHHFINDFYGWFQVDLRVPSPTCRSADRNFKLVPVTSDADDVSSFMVTTSGQVCVTAPLDFESKSFYQFYVLIDNNSSTPGILSISVCVCFDNKQVLVERKGNEEYLYSAFIQRLVSKRSDMDHQMAPPLNVVANM